MNAIDKSESVWLAVLVYKLHASGCGGGGGGGVGGYGDSSDGSCDSDENRRATIGRSRTVRYYSFGVVCKLKMVVLSMMVVNKPLSSFTIISSHLSPPPSQPTLLHLGP